MHVLIWQRSIILCFLFFFLNSFLSDFYRLYIYIELYSYKNYEFNFEAYMFSKLKENF